jgi:hypothetical protein
VVVLAAYLDEGANDLMGVDGGREWTAPALVRPSPLWGERILPSVAGGRAVGGVTVTTVRKHDLSNRHQFDRAVRFPIGEGGAVQDAIMVAYRDETLTEKPHM